MKKLYKVEFHGHVIGGVAIVRAESEEDAVEKTESHEKYPEDSEIVSVTKIHHRQSIIYFDDGDM